MKQLCAIYRRVSTQGQAEKGTSLDGQEILCRAVAQRHGLTVVHVYTDAGVSGAYYQERQGLQQALTDMQSGLFEVLIIADFSRYSRDREHQEAIRKRVANAGGRLLFGDVTIDDSPEGGLMFGVVGSIAAYEKDKIRQRCRDGKRNRAREGKQVARGYVPFGYRVVTKVDVIRGEFGPEQEGQYVLLESEAHWARRIFHSYAHEGNSLYDCVRELQSAGVRTKRGLSNWSATTIAGMLRNPVYRGEAVFGRNVHYTDESRLTEGYVSDRGKRRADPAQWITIPAPALVDPETWNRCQERLKENAKTSGRPDRRWLLTGLVRCPFCGDPVSGRKRSGRERNYYACRRQFPCYRKKGTCDNSTCYHQDVLEPLVVRGVALIAQAPERIREAVRTFTEEAREANGRYPSADRRAALVTEKERIEQRIAAIVEAQIQAIGDGIDTGPYRAQLQLRQKELRSLEEQLREMPAVPTANSVSSASLTPDDIALLLSGAGRLAEAVLLHPERDETACNAILRKLIDRVEIEPHERNTTAVHWSKRPTQPEMIHIHFAPVVGVRDNRLSVRSIVIRLSNGKISPLFLIAALTRSRDS
ncbi:MAG: recombinase family protein [Capsulimonadales bacterium]|nr:recombinase family protein [Capsulimonadales bacterium]